MLECFLVALRLGLIAFGGPVAHIGYFRDEYVIKRQWLSEERFAELMALCQFIPGPSSSQLGAAIGAERGGLAGGAAAWLGFTLPSAVVMYLFAIGLSTFSIHEGALHGLQIVALAVVTVAVMNMRKQLCPDLPRQLIAITSLTIMWFLPAAWIQIVAIAMGASVGSLAFRKKVEIQKKATTSSRIGKSSSALSFFVALLVLLPLLGSEYAFIQGLYQSGALVFGGGHVVLPLLEQEIVAPGLLTQEDFLTGYGAVQAVPGPVFTISSYLGGRIGMFESPLLGAVLGTVSIFLPGMLLLMAGLPIWAKIRHIRSVRAATIGANAAVVGLLGAALLGIVKKGMVHDAQSFLFYAILTGLILSKTIPTWLLVISSSLIGWAIL